MSTLSTPSTPSKRAIRISSRRDQFTVADGSGFRVYGLINLMPRFEHPNLGELALADALDNTNIVIVVAKDSRTIQFWDDQANRYVGIAEVGEQILGAQVTRTLTIAVCKNQVRIYGTISMYHYGSLPTYDNPRAALDIVRTVGSYVFACPGEHVGQVRIYNALNGNTHVIQAHTHPVVLIKFSDDGKMLATASERGTLVRVWGSDTGGLLGEYRRGTEGAIIHDVAWDPLMDYLLTISDRGTLHIHSITRERKPDEPMPEPNARSVVGMLPLMPRYFSSEWSLRQYSVPASNTGGIGVTGGAGSEVASEVEYRATFTIDGARIVVVASNGMQYRFPFRVGNKLLTETAPTVITF